MQSKHGFILALMAGAGALIVVLAGFLSLEYLNQAEPYLSGQDIAADSASPSEAPHLVTKLEGSTVQIVEADKNGDTLRVILSSDLHDDIADFSLFAVPTQHYQGFVYVQSVQDADGATLIVYPLEVASGKLKAAVINTPSSHATVSPDQTRVAVLTLSQAPQIILFDITTGLPLASWSLAAGERLTSTASRTYTGEGVRFTSSDCFEHTVWTAAASDNRLFCLEGESF
jgi:hypothetical protein